MLPAEPALRLVEVWRGEVAGGRLARAGLTGCVEWVSQEAKATVRTVQFGLQVGTRGEGEGGGHGAVQPAGAACR